MLNESDILKLNRSEKVDKEISVLPSLDSLSNG